MPIANSSLKIELQAFQKLHQFKGPIREFLLFPSRERKNSTLTRLTKHLTHVLHLALKSNKLSRGNMYTPELYIHSHFEIIQVISIVLPYLFAASQDNLNDYAKT